MAPTYIDSKVVIGYTRDILRKKEALMNPYEKRLALRLEEAKRTRDYRINKGLVDVQRFFFHILEEKLERALENGEHSVIAYGYDPKHTVLSRTAINILIRLSEETIIYNDMYISEVFQPYIDGFIVCYYKNSYDEQRLSVEFKIKDELAYV